MEKTQKGHKKVFYNNLRSPTQADHSSRRSHYSQVFLILLSCFSCGKIEESLVTYNVSKPGI